MREDPYDSKKIQEAIIQSLRENGYKITPQRREIIHVVVEDRGHPSATTICRKARKKYPGMSLSTAYLTLSLLKELKLVKELEFDEMENRYDGNTSVHLNLICERCGKIEDFAAKLPVSTKLVLKRTGFQAKDTRLEYSGLCKRCARKRAG